MTYNLEGKGNISVYYQDVIFLPEQALNILLVFILGQKLYNNVMVLKLYSVLEVTRYFGIKLYGG